MKTRIKKVQFNDGRVEYLAQQYKFDFKVIMIFILFPAGILILFKWDTLYTCQTEMECRHFLDELHSKYAEEKLKAHNAKIKTVTYTKYP